MKNILWIFKTEFLQNKVFFLLTVLTSLFLGICAVQGKFAIDKIESLSVHEKWNADVVVLPKGMALADLKQEILTGSPTLFLPEALFDSTRDLIKNQFSLSAILPIKNDGKVEVLHKGDNLGLGWLDSSIEIVPWQDQAQYQTNEWNTRVVAALFASGPKEVMKSFKDLIDRKTIGQAFIIEDEMAKGQAQHDDMLFYLRLVSVLILSLFVSVIFLLAYLLRNRLKNVYEILRNHGYQKQVQQKLNTLVFVLFILGPLMIGMILSFPFNPFT